MKNNPKKPEAVVVAADDEEGTLFAFTCTFDYAAVADKLNDELTASSTLWKCHIPSLQNRLPSSDRHIKTALYKT